MKKGFAVVVALLLAVACCGCTAAAPKTDAEEILASGKLVIGITIYEPMNYYDGETLVGFDTEFAQAVCEKLGVEPVFQVIDWNTKETTLKAKNIDCIWNGLTVTEPRKKDMDFTTSYLVNRQCVVIRSADAEKYTTTEALASAMISAESGSAGETAVKEDNFLKNATYTAADSQSDAMLALSAGNCDAAVVDYTLASTGCGQGAYTDLMLVEGIQLANENYAIGFRKDSDMTAKVNAIIADMVQDGTLAAIAEKYAMAELYAEAIR